MTVAFGAIGSKSPGTGTTSELVPYPASVGAADYLVLADAGWPSSAGVNALSGWTVAQLGGGTGTSVDAHTTTIAAFHKQAAGGETGNVTVGRGGTPTGQIGVMVRYTKTAASWSPTVTVSGTDNTHAANRSITTGAVDLQPGDMVVLAVSTDTDTALTITSPTLTASGITFGTVNRRTSGAGTGTGEDGNVELFDAVVASGSGSVAVTFAFTTGTSQCGPVVLVRLREAADMAATTAATSGVSASLDVIPGGGGATTHQMAATTDATAGMAASMALQAAMQATSAATGAVIASLRGLFAMAGVTASTSASTATLSMRASMQATAPGTSAVVASMSSLGTMSATIPATSALAAALDVIPGGGGAVTHSMAATTPASATVTATLRLIATMSPSPAVATSATSGALRGLFTMGAVVPASAGSTGTMRLLAVLGATTAASAGSAADLRAILRVAATTPAVAGVTADLTLLSSATADPMPGRIVAVPGRGRITVPRRAVPAATVPASRVVDVPGRDSTIVVSATHTTHV